MNKNNIAKIKLYLVGLNARLTQNLDYFMNIEMNFDNGKNKTIMNISYSDGKFVLKQGKKEQNIIQSEIGDIFINNIESCENATLIYRERGSSTHIICTTKNVTMKQFEEQDFSEDSTNPLISKREYIINVNKAKSLLSAIGILTKEGKVKNDMIRKYNQIDHYVELVAPMFESHDDSEILLLDLACGKSYLSFVLNYYLRDVLKKRCKVIGVDISENVIEKSKKIAKELDYNNMEFICADLRTFSPPKNVTAVISLHACDIATDLALGTAINAGAKYIACVPCCHKELLDTYKIPELMPILKHGIFKARMNDLLTDGLRALKLEAKGYKVSVVEYISPLDTPKNLLIRAEKTSEINEEAAAQYENLTQSLGTYSELDRQCKFGNCIAID